MGRTGTTKSGGKCTSPSRTGATQRMLPHRGPPLRQNPYGPTSMSMISRESQSPASIPST